MANMIATQRLFLTADKEALVGESHIDAAFLYAVPGDEILPEMAEKFGLVDGALPEDKAKEKKAPADKAKPAAETKGA